jgi:Peptidase family M23/Double zinc ribbon
MTDILSAFLGLVAKFLLDNCSSLYDCWDNVIPAAAAAVGAGAAAVLAGGLLLNPENQPGPLGDEPPGVPLTPPLPGHSYTSSQPFQPSQPVGMSGVGPAGPAGPAMPAPGGHSTPPPTPPGSSIPVPGVIGAVGVAGGVGAAASSVASPRQGSGSAAGSDTSDDSAEEAACPQADPTLFGLPDNNTRQDCTGSRAGLGPTHTGIDFTSLDERGQVRLLPFDACVSGTVSFVGGPFNMVEVTLKNGSRMQFLHASRTYVRVGEKVGSTTRLGVTGGTGPQGPNQYEPHLHIQALDKDDNLIDPDCALAGKEDRKLKVNAPKTKGRKKQPAASTAQQTAPTPPQSPTMPLTPPSPAMLMCGTCGMSNPSGSGFCGRCGRPLVQSAPQPGMTCGRCGLFNPPGAAFCGRCGTRLHHG